jgi:hypothetical protein
MVDLGGSSPSHPVPTNVLMYQSSPIVITNTVKPQVEIGVQGQEPREHARARVEFVPSPCETPPLGV